MMTQKINCPHCKSVTEWEGNESRPFCSERCRLIDLGHWANEEYSVAGKYAPQPDRDDELEY